MMVTDPAPRARARPARPTFCAPRPKRVIARNEFSRAERALGVRMRVSGPLLNGPETRAKRAEPARETRGIRAEYAREKGRAACRFIARRAMNVCECARAFARACVAHAGGACGVRGMSHAFIARRAMNASERARAPSRARFRARALRMRAGHAALVPGGDGRAAAGLNRRSVMFAASRDGLAGERAVAGGRCGGGWGRWRTSSIGPKGLLGLSAFRPQFAGRWWTWSTTHKLWPKGLPRAAVQAEMKSRWWTGGGPRPKGLLPKGRRVCGRVLRSRRR